ncbi:unnamed protein product, partial [Pylaiella littoralis]
WCFDSGSSGHVSFDATKMTNYRPCNKFLRVASGAQLRIEGRGDLLVDFQSGPGQVRVKLMSVAHAPTASYHLLSLPACVKQGHTYNGDSRGITMHLKSGQTLLAPLVGNLHYAYGYRLGSEIEQTCAVLAPGRLSTKNVDINAYHRSTAHTHELLLRKSAAQQGVVLEKGSKLLPCVGCSLAKGISAPIHKTTACRSDKKLGRVFVDLTGKQPVKSIGGKQYSIIFRDDKTRMSWEYFLRTKDEAVEAFEQFLTDVGTPKIIRTDDARELIGGPVKELCRKNRIKRECTTADRAPLNGVAER